MLKKILLISAIIFIASFASASEINRYILDKPFAAINIQFSDNDNNIHQLNDYKGRVVLLNFWATWCKPCVHEMPALENLSKFMEGKGIEIVPVSIDFKGVDVVKKFYEEQEISSLPIFVDIKGRAFKEYKLQALPTTLIIDGQGMVVAKVIGEIDWDSKSVRDYLLSLASSR
jgi:thiol-disulfide isomerase/thioredoxin